MRWFFFSLLISLALIFFLYMSIFFFCAAPFPRMAKCTFTLGRFDHHQDTDHNSNRSSCWIDHPRECKNRVTSISRRRVWICSFFSCKQVSHKLVQFTTTLRVSIPGFFLFIEFSVFFKTGLVCYHLSLTSCS